MTEEQSKEIKPKKTLDFGKRDKFFWIGVVIGFLIGFILILYSFYMGGCC